MTEQDWLTGTDPTPLLWFLRGRASDRKLRLFAVACCHGVWKWMPDERSRGGVEAAERLADGLVGEDEWQVAYNEAGEANDEFVGELAYLSESARAAWYALTVGPEFKWVGDVVRSAIRLASSGAVDGYHFSIEADSEEVRAATSREHTRQLRLLRFIFGNPFRPVTADPTWLTPTAVTLARAIYAERAFDRLPILADALEEAGCNDPDVLTHLRGDGPHVRGCWVVDLLLGRG
ncbi:MAG TPA: hypothetical protein VM533_21125 [Fimbriiglobus sp.]|nr:hypothetical protein [Fimbriiglobus sp.]